MNQEIQDAKQSQEAPRCSPGVFSDKLVSIVDDLHRKLNGESQVETIPIIISLEQAPLKLDRHDRQRVLDILRQKNPKIFDYLEDHKIPYVPLGASSGKIVANPALKQLVGLQNFGNSIKIDYAPNDFELYSRVFRPKHF